MAPKRASTITPPRRSPRITEQSNKRQKLATDHPVIHPPPSPPELDQPAPKKQPTKKRSKPNKATTEDTTDTSASSPHVPTEPSQRKPIPQDNKPNATSHPTAANSPSTSKTLLRLRTRVLEHDFRSRVAAMEYAKQADITAWKRAIKLRGL